MPRNVALMLAIASAFAYGAALVTGRLGLRSIDPIAGAAISIPTATILFALLAPLAIDWAGFDLRAAVIFALVGLVFPAIVTLLTFRSNEVLGPTVTATVSSTAPLFALLAAAMFLGETLTLRIVLCAIAVVAGIALVSWRAGTRARLRALGWPLAGAMLRGLAQVGAKAGLLLWPNPFAASLIGYLVSTATVIAVDRAGTRPARRTEGVAWFALTGVLNGGAVALMYAALTAAPVSMVAPVVATYPLVTVVMSALVLRETRLLPRVVVGALVTVIAVVLLVSS